MTATVRPGLCPSAFLSLLLLLPAARSLDLLDLPLPSSLSCAVCRSVNLVGFVADCSCDFETVDAATHSYYHPLLDQLQSTAYFRYFKVNLDEQCPFWEDTDSLCMMKVA